MNRRPESPSHRFSRKSSRVARDLLTIAELQGQLFFRDLQAMRSGATVGAVACLAGLGLLVAAVPIGLAGTGIWIASVWNLGTGPGLIGAMLAACLLAAGLLWGGWRHLRERVSLERSRAELAENIALLKSMLNDLSHAAPHSGDEEVS
jgi:hypothetical protein